MSKEFLQNAPPEKRCLIYLLRSDGGDQDEGRAGETKRKKTNFKKIFSRTLNIEDTWQRSLILHVQF